MRKANLELISNIIELLRENHKRRIKAWEILRETLEDESYMRDEQKEKEFHEVLLACIDDLKGLPCKRHSKDLTND